MNPSPLTIVRYPDPVLSQRAAPIEDIDQEVRDLASNMVQLMYEADGVGLAAPQVGWDARVFVINVSGSEEFPEEQMAFINPQLEFIDRDEQDSFEEGCLSLPGIRLDLDRPLKVRVQALDRDGRPFTLEAEELLGRCIQHENDHLDGILIPSRVSTLRRMGIRGQLRELEEEWDPSP